MNIRGGQDTHTINHTVVFIRDDPQEVIEEASLLISQQV